MTHKSRMRKEKERRRVARSQSAPHRSRPAKTTKARPALAEAGNAAITRLLDGKQGGKPLASRVRAEMEHAYGADFSHVRVHDDPTARANAKAVGARAFTRGADIYLGPSGPSLDSSDGKKMLAHELAHVVQQDRASTVEHGVVSNSGDSFEREADAAASRVVSGQGVQIQSSGNPPAVQRDPERVSRAEVEAAVRQFLERARQAQGGQSVRVTTEVRNAIEMLARAPGPQNDTGRTSPNEMTQLMMMQIWLDGGLLPSTSADFAREVARRLPDPFDAAALARLAQMPVAASTSMVGRVRSLIERTAPGSPDRAAEPPREPTSNERFERGMSDFLRQAGRPQPTPTMVGPVDVLRIGRIFSGLPSAVRAPAPQSREPEARSYANVTTVTQQVSPDALVPAEARGGPTADNFADAREVAAQLARLLDVAQQQGRDSIDLPLGPSYENIRDPGAITAQIRTIAQQIRAALPHHATSVRTINVYFGRHLRWVPIGQPARTE